MQNKRKPIHEAYERCKVVRHLLSEIGEPREQIEDKCGLVIQRWIVGKTPVVLWANPDGWGMFQPIDDCIEVAPTLAKLRELAKE